MASAAAGAQRRCVMLWTALLIGWIVPISARPTSGLAAPPPSPLDALDASRIDPKDRVVGLPAELVALLGSNRGRHSEPVKCLAVSPDAQWLASGSRDQTVRLWDPATLVQRQVLTGYHGDVNSVVFAPDSKRLFSTSEDGKVHVHEMNEGRWTPSKSIPLMPRGVAVVFPGAKTVLSNPWPPTNEDLRLFRIFDSRVESAHPALAGLIQWPDGGAALSGNGRWLACGGTGKAREGLAIGVYIWDLRDRSSRPRWMLDMPSGHIESVAFSPDGRR
jgi:WD40 repeat protein